MFKKIFTSLVILVVVFSTSETFSQEDARVIPYYLKTTEQNSPRIYRTRDIYKPGVITPDRLKHHPLPEQMLTEDGIQLVNVSGTNGHQSETWIAINPANPNNLISGANDYRYNHPGERYKMGAYFSKDGGKTWSLRQTPYNMGRYIEWPSGGGMTNFDPGLAFDSRGWAYYCYGFAQTFDQGEGDNGVFVSRSKDGGDTWEDPIPVEMTANGTSNQPFHDRYMIAADFIEGSPYKDRIYVTWQRFKINPSIVISYSTDGGESWSSVTSVRGGDNGVTQSPMPAVGPNGEVYVVWQNRSTSTDKTDALVQKSVDGGNTWFSSPRIAQTVRTSGTQNSQSGRFVFADKQNIRVSSYPEIAVDVSNSPYRGHVYVIQSGRDNAGTSSILMAKSSDGGETWTKSLRVDDNSLNNDVFFPSIAVDPKTGLVAVLYYSSQNDSKNKGVDAYVAVSMDGGATFNRIRLTPKTWFLDHDYDVSYQGLGNYYWGDYTSLVAWGGKIYPSFWMPNSSTGRFDDNNVYTAMLSLSPLAVSNLTAENSYQAPNIVKLKWTDPEKNQLGSVLGDFKVHVYRDDEKLGEVNKGVQEFTDNNAVDGKTYNYKLKVVSDNFESNEKVITVVVGGALKPLPPTEITCSPDANGVMLTWKNPGTHIDNSVFHDFKRINIYNGTEKIKSIDVTPAQAGQYGSLLIDLPVKKFYHLKMSAVGLRGETETESDITGPFLAYAGAPLSTKDYNESFDGAQELIPSLTWPIGKWAKTTKSAKSAPNAITDSPTGNYSDELDYIYFAPVVITGDDTTLSFDHIAIIDKNDRGVLSISNDHGKSWSEILWINKERSAGFTESVETSTWYSEHISIGQFRNDTIIVRFNLWAANQLKNLDGWYIDNLMISDIAASVDDSNIPEIIVFASSYPNPTNGKSTINLNSLNNGNALVAIYDVMGNLVEKIADQQFKTGENSFDIDLTDRADGIYYCRITMNGFTKTLPVIVAR